jgi:hypothetical protein
MIMPFDSVALGTVVDTIALGGQSYTVASTVTDVSAQMSYGDADILYQIVVYSGGGMDQKYAERFETFIYNGDTP